MASDTQTERPSIAISNALAGFPDQTRRPEGPQPARKHPGGLSPDAVVFTASCPACRQDCVWSEEREDTRVNVAVTCPCG